MKAKNTDIFMDNKVFIWIAAATGLILLIPLIAMQFTDEVTWTFSDFLIIGTLLFGTGLIFVLLARRIRKHRLIMGLVVLVILLWVWAELAVGIFTNWGS